MKNWKEKGQIAFRCCKKGIFLVVFALLVTGALGQKAEAAPTTKQEVKKEIKKTKKKVKKLKRTCNKLKKQYERLRKEANAKLEGTHSLILAKMETSSPYIVWDNNYGSYYCITNAKRSDFNLGYFSGSVKVTGKRKVNGYLCKVGRVIRSNASDKSWKVLKKYEKKNEQLKSAKAKLKNLQRASNYYLEMGEDSFTVYKGVKEKLFPKKKCYNEFTFKSSNESIVKVYPNGDVEGISVGEATITAKASISKETSKFKIIVKEAVQGIQLNYTDVKMKLGDTLQLTAKLLPEGASEKLLFDVDENSCVEVSETGLVQAVRYGEANVTVMVAGSSAECKATCKIRVCDFTEQIGVYMDVENSNLIEMDGDQIKTTTLCKSCVFTIRKLDKNGRELREAYETFTATSSDESILKVTTEGEFAYSFSTEFLKAGKVTLTITASNGVSRQLEIEIVEGRL